MRNSFIKNITILLLISILLICCKKDKISGELIENQNLSKELYSSSQDTVFIENSKFIIEAGLSRDFFPGGPMPGKTPLIADIFLINLDSIAIPAYIDIIKLYVINQKVIWVSNPGPASQNQELKFKLEKINSYGPEWPTDILVDVIVEIRNNNNNNNYFLISKNKNIDKTE